MAKRGRDVGATPKWSARDYELAAGILHSAYDALVEGRPAGERQNASITALAYITAQYITTFQADNPRFDLERFCKAVGFSQFNGEAFTRGPSN